MARASSQTAARWIVSSLILIVAVMVASSFVAVARANRGPSTPSCILAWNAPSNHANQGEVARAGFGRAGFGRAIVRGTMDESTFPGCAVIFVAGAGRPWHFYGRELTQASWSEAIGRSWGHDSPQGPNGNVNAWVSSRGTIRER